jgi:hypothetical protein
MTTSPTTQIASPMIFSWDGDWYDVAHHCLDTTLRPTGGRSRENRFDASLKGRRTVNSPPFSSRDDPELPIAWARFVLSCTSMPYDPLSSRAGPPMTALAKA